MSLLDLECRLLRSVPSSEQEQSHAPTGQDNMSLPRFDGLFRKADTARSLVPSPSMFPGDLEQPANLVEILNPACSDTTCVVKPGERQAIAYIQREIPTAVLICQAKRHWPDHDPMPVLRAPRIIALLGMKTPCSTVHGSAIESVLIGERVEKV